MYVLCLADLTFLFPFSSLISGDGWRIRENTL